MPSPNAPRGGSQSFANQQLLNLLPLCNATLWVSEVPAERPGHYEGRAKISLAWRSQQAMPLRSHVASERALTTTPPRMRA